MTVTIRQLNEVYLRIDCPKDVASELYDYFTFMAHNYKFHPKYRAGQWNGEIHLFSKRDRTIFRGLLNEVRKFCHTRGYDIAADIDDCDESFSIKECRDFIQSLNLPDNFEIRDYQLASIIYCIRKSRAAIVSPTGSGKSAVIYALYRFYDIQTLIIVPTTALVHQMYGDFEDYSKNDTWKAENRCSKLMYGMSRADLKQCVIATWQTLIKMPPEWFSRFGVVIVDEVHQAKAVSITNIMKSLTNTKYRFGFTGTLDDVDIHKLTIEGLFGPVKQVVKTKELLDRKILADLTIKAIVLKHEDYHRQSLMEERIQAARYRKEIDFLIGYRKRNQFIANLADSLNGNTLILYQYVEKHGELLYDIISTASQKKIELIHGAVNGLERNDIKERVNNSTNNIMIASYGTTSTGINLVAIDNIILASPTKSKIRLLQSIGRGLRRSKTKSKCTIFDIADDLSCQGKDNYTFLHFKERMDVYKREQFHVKIYKVNLK